jgi:histidinol phosphatase-like PHP family hydrolase
MKSQKELREIFQSYSWAQINVHVHTHLCDGKPDMTVENIAKKAEEVGVKLVVLTPHYHKQLKDSHTVLYDNSDESIFVKLREEINEYEKKSGKVRFLLSSEADIISVDGTLSLEQSKLVEENLDFIMPTLNFHPLLPLRAVDVTNLEGREKLHGSGEYMSMVDEAGGMEKIIEAMYTAQANAIQNISFPAMLGHFFAAHSKNGPYNWFGLREEHLPMMMEGAEKVLESCKSTGTMIDITGNRIKDTDI